MPNIDNTNPKFTSQILMKNSTLPNLPKTAYFGVQLLNHLKKGTTWVAMSKHDSIRPLRSNNKNEDPLAILMHRGPVQCFQVYSSKTFGHLEPVLNDFFNLHASGFSYLLHFFSVLFCCKYII